MWSAFSLSEDILLPKMSSVRGFDVPIFFPFLVFTASSKLGFSNLAPASLGLFRSVSACRPLPSEI